VVEQNKIGEQAKEAGFDPQPGKVQKSSLTSAAEISLNKREVKIRAEQLQPKPELIFINENW
jgi:hypothetical protein